MNIRDVEALVAVIETGSLVGAATRLNLTQPGVTRRIQALEQLLGQPLLDRRARPFKPTTAGRNTYEYGRRMLQLLDDLETQLSPDGPIRGEMRIGVTPHMSEVALTDPLDRLRASCPDLFLRITTGWAEQLLDQVKRGEVDVVGLHLPHDVDPPGGFEWHALGVMPLVVVAANSATLLSRTSLRDLGGFPWVLHPEGCGFRNILQRRLETERLPFTVGIEALSSELRLSLVARDVGISIATRVAVETSAFAPQLRIIDVTDFRPAVRAWLVHRQAIGRLAEPVRHLSSFLSGGYD